MNKIEKFFDDRYKKMSDDKLLKNYLKTSKALTKDKQDLLVANENYNKKRQELTDWENRYSGLDEKSAEIMMDKDRKRNRILGTIVGGTVLGGQLILGDLIETNSFSQFIHSETQMWENLSCFCAGALLGGLTANVAVEGEKLFSKVVFPATRTSYLGTKIFHQNIKMEKLKNEIENRPQLAEVIDCDLDETIENILDDSMDL